MIHYTLRCAQEHEFESWFRDSASFEQQATSGLLECPMCGSVQVDRALMTPAVAKRGRKRSAVIDQSGADQSGKGQSGKGQSGKVQSGNDQSGQDKAPPAAPEGANPQASVQATAPPSSALAAAGHRLPDQVRAMLQRLRSEVEKNCDYVGPKFADEARKMHRGEIAGRGIYGETSPEQAEALVEEGIEVSSIPWIPRADG